LLALEDGTDVPGAGIWATVVDALVINVASMNVDVSERTPQEAAERMQFLRRALDATYMQNGGHGGNLASTVNTLANNLFGPIHLKNR
jgi:hypothetical protein